MKNFALFLMSFVMFTSCKNDNFTPVSENNFKIDENSTELQILEHQLNKAAFKENLLLRRDNFTVNLEVGSFEKKKLDAFLENYEISLENKITKNVTKTKDIYNSTSRETKNDGIFFEYFGDIDRALLANYALRVKIKPNRTSKNLRSILDVGDFEYTTGSNPNYASLLNNHSNVANWEYKTKACWLCGFNGQDSGTLNQGESEDVNPPNHLYKVRFEGTGEQGEVYFSWY